MKTTLSCRSRFQLIRNKLHKSVNEDDKVEGPQQVLLDYYYFGKESDRCFQENANVITGMKTISNAEFRIFTETTKVEKIERDTGFSKSIGDTLS